VGTSVFCLSTAPGGRERIYHHPDAFVSKSPPRLGRTLAAVDIYNDLDQGWLADDSFDE